MRFAYADPPYPGQSWRHYGRAQRKRPAHADYAGEVDPEALLSRLESGLWEGWALHTHQAGLLYLAPLLPEGVRVCIWAKRWVPFHKGVGVAHAWEPVLVKPCRKRSGPEGDRPVVRDWLDTMPTFSTGVAGAKPALVCQWVFELAGLEPEDELDDLYPGSGAVQEAWASWQRAPQLQPQLTQEALDG